MINLLPSEVSHELRAARMNTMLRKYLITSVLAMVAIMVVFGGAFYINYMNFEAYKLRRDTSEQELSKLQAIKQRIGRYNANLQQAKKVFASEIHLTNLVENISSTLPPGAVLDNVSLDAVSFTKPASIVARVDTFEKAGVLERNLKQSGLFTEVILNSVEGTADADAASVPTDNLYPFSAQLSVTLGPDAARAGFNPGAAEGTQ